MSGRGSPIPNSSARTPAGRSGERIWLMLCATAVGALSFAGLGYITQNTLRLALDEVRRDPTQVELAPTLAIVLIVVVPLFLAAFSYFVVWQIRRLIQLARYLARVRRHTGDILRRAPLLRLGYSGTGLPFDMDGRPRLDKEQPLAAMLPGDPGTLLLGDDGSGKTTALRRCAFELARRRHLWGIAFGHAPMPIIVPLAAYAAAPIEPGRPRLRFLSEQVAAFGHRRLADRFAGALARWHVALLCDGLDEVPAADQRAVAAELAQLASADYPGVRVVVTCSLELYLEEADQLSDIATLPRVVVTGIPARNIDLIIRRAPQRVRGGRTTFEEPSARLAHSGLGAQVGHPATLAAWLELQAAGQAAPAGRGRLLHGYLDVLEQQGASHEAETTQPLRALLSQLANGLRSSGESYVAIPDTMTAGQAVAEWLARAATVTPVANRPLAPLEVASDDIDRLLEAAIEAGILEWLPARWGVRFAQAALGATYAAHSLEYAGARFDTLDAVLLSPEWHEPLLLWSGFAAQPGALVTAILRHAGTRQDRRASIHVLALGLAAALEAFAPTLAPSDPTAMVKDALPQVKQTHEQLRDVFDYIQASVLRPEDRAHWGAALTAIERRSLIDLGEHLSAIATSGSMGRLLRAQAISLLGLLASPTAIETLIELLRETDPVLRQATDQAFAGVNPSGLARLQTLLSSSDAHLRARATEALSRAGPAAIETALDGLDSADPLHRAAAASVLGALGATDVSEPLLARLDDPDRRVRVAAAQALGQIGASDIGPRIELHLATADSELRVALATALGNLRQPEALPALVDLLNDADARVRAAAAEALGKVSDERAIEPLRKRLGDNDPWAQAAAATALRRLGTR